MPTPALTITFTTIRILTFNALSIAILNLGDGPAQEIGKGMWTQIHEMELREHQHTIKLLRCNVSQHLSISMCTHTHTRARAHTVRHRMWMCVLR